MPSQPLVKWCVAPNLITTKLKRKSRALTLIEDETDVSEQGIPKRTYKRFDAKELDATPTVKAIQQPYRP